MAPSTACCMAPLRRELAATAKVKPLTLPPPIDESGYRPSAALAEFVRCRDLTCRFPGCDQPARVCDVDHTIPFPAEPTHPSNDTDALQRVDAALAHQVTRWGALSVKKTEQAIDAIVAEHDPGARRRTRRAEQGRTVEIGSPTMRPVWRTCGGASTPPTPRCRSAD
jgi:hypothetical protein